MSKNILGGRDLNSVDKRALSMLSSTMRHVQVQYTPTKSRKSKFKIMKIVQATAYTHFFDVKDESGRTKNMNVYEFFDMTYNVKLRYPSYPLVEVNLFFCLFISITQG